MWISEADWKNKWSIQLTIERMMIPQDKNHSDLLLIHKTQRKNMK